MTMTPEQVDAYVDAAAAALDLPIAPAYRPGVIENFSRNAAIAATFLDFPLPDEVETAPVFRP